MTLTVLRALPTRLRILIFDLDGTLIDSMEQHAGIFAALLERELGIPLMEGRRGYRRMAGASLAEQIRAAVPPSHSLSEATIERLIGRFTSVIADSQPVLFTEVKDVVRRLQKGGFGLAVSSGAPTILVEAKLRMSGIAEYFDIALGTDLHSLLMVKGAGHFKLIRERFSLSERDFIEMAAMIGDTKHDMELASQEGLVAVGRTGWCRRADLLQAGASAVVDNLNELLKLIAVGDSL